jgi:hypothetical protein
LAADGQKRTDARFGLAGRPASQDLVIATFQDIVMIRFCDCSGDKSGRPTLPAAEGRHAIRGTCRLVHPSSEPEIKDRPNLGNRVPADAGLRTFVILIHI